MKNKFKKYLNSKNHQYGLHDCVDGVPEELDVCDSHDGHVVLLLLGHLAVLPLHQALAVHVGGVGALLRRQVERAALLQDELVQIGRDLRLEEAELGESGNLRKTFDLTNMFLRKK